jgi:spore coat polysaccharide biosynthesis protein SpsF
MTSIRLPGKVLRLVLGKPLLQYQVERLQRVLEGDELVIATTTNFSDLPIVDLCTTLKIPFFRGSEEDVLSRYFEAAVHCEADIVVRITADCPIIDPKVIDKVIRFFLDHEKNYDYVSNDLQPSYPRGMDVEVFPMRVLREAFKEANQRSEREHVTPFIYTRPERYRLGNVSYRKDCSNYRWTVDTIEDFELIEKMIQALYPKDEKFGLEDCLLLLSQHPDWMKINACVEQKRFDS